MIFPVKQIVLGQYVGIGLLIAISALGSLIALVVPPYIIGILGIVPIAIGTKRLVQIIKREDQIFIQYMHRKRVTVEGKNNIYHFWLSLL